MFNNIGKKYNKITYSAFLITLMTIVFKVIAFFKQAIIAYVFGLSEELDSYFMALNFIVGGANTIVYALYVSLVTSYSSLLITKGKKDADYLINSILEILFPIFIILMILIMIFSSYIAKFLVPSGINASFQYLVSKFLFILSPLILFTIFELVFGAVLDSQKNYVISRLKSLISSISIILASLFLSKLIGVYSLLFGEYITGVVFSLILIINVRKYCKLKITKLHLTPEIKHCIITAIPMFIGNGTLQLNAIIDNSLASTLGAGNVSALAYCNTITDLINKIVIVNIGNILFTHFADYVAEKRFELINKSLEKVINIFIVVLLFISIVSVTFSEEIVNIIFGRGQFTYNNVKLTAAALVGYSVSFLILGIRDMLLKANYSFSDTFHPMIAGIFTLILNVVTSIILIKRLGLMGIALGSSISYILELFLNYKAFKSKSKSFTFKENVKTLLKMLPISFIYFIICLIFKNFVMLNDFVKLIIVTIIGIIFFSGWAYIIKIQDVKLLVDKLIRKK